MNKLLLLILFTIWLSTSCQNQSNNIEKPKIQLEKDTCQLGLISKGDSVVVHLKVKNVGGGILNITNIGYGCGCTKGKIEKKSLECVTY
jgi:hypothetical protein